MIYLIGRDFFKRKNPKTSNYIDFEKNYTLFNLSDYEFNLMYIVTDYENKYVDKSLYNDLIEVDAYIKKFKKGSLQEKIPLNTNLCKDIYKNKELPDYELEHLKCVDTQNEFLYGNYDSDIWHTISIEVISKIEVKDNLDSYSDKKRIKEFEKMNLYLNVFVNDVKILPNDYEKGLSLSYIVSFYPISFDKSLRAFSQKYFILNNVISDYGWIFQNSKELNALGFSIEDKKPMLSFLPNHLVLIELMTEKNKKYYTREFPKIQTLVAELGGILNFFMLIFSQLSYQYSFYHLKIKVYKTLTKLDENKSNCVDKIHMNANHKIDAKRHNSLNSNESVTMPKEKLPSKFKNNDLHHTPNIILNNIKEKDSKSIINEIDKKKYSTNSDFSANRSDLMSKDKSKIELNSNNTSFNPLASKFYSIFKGLNSLKKIRRENTCRLL
jgi:hypothetical protein